MAPAMTREKIDAAIDQVRRALEESNVFAKVPKHYLKHAKDYWLHNELAKFRLDRFVVGWKADVKNIVKQISNAIDIRNKKDLWMCVIEDEKTLKKVAMRNPEEAKKVERVKKCINWGALYFSGEDKDGRPICQIRFRKLPKKLAKEEEELLMRGCVFAFDAMERKLDRKRLELQRRNGPERADWKWNLLLDCGKLQIPTSHARKVGRDLVDTMTLFYPERGMRTCIVDPDWVCWAILKMVKPFLPAETKSRMIEYSRGKNFLEKKKKIPQLAAAVEDRWVPVEYGGTYSGNFDGNAYWKESIMSTSMLPEQRATISLNLQALRRESNDEFPEVKDDNSRSICLGSYMKARNSYEDGLIQKASKNLENANASGIIKNVPKVNASTSKTVTFRRDIESTDSMSCRTTKKSTPSECSTSAGSTPREPGSKTSSSETIFSKTNESSSASSSASFEAGECVFVDNPYDYEQELTEENLFMTPKSGSNAISFEQRSQSASRLFSGLFTASFSGLLGRTKISAKKQELESEKKERFGITVSQDVNDFLDLRRCESKDFEETREVSSLLEDVKEKNPHVKLAKREFDDVVDSMSVGSVEVEDAVTAAEESEVVEESEAVVEERDEQEKLIEKTRSLMDCNIPTLACNSVSFAKYERKEKSSIKKIALEKDKMLLNRGFILAGDDNKDVVSEPETLTASSIQDLDAIVHGSLSMDVRMQRDDCSMSDSSDVSQDSVGCEGVSMRKASKRRVQRGLFRLKTPQQLHLFMEKSEEFEQSVTSGSSNTELMSARSELLASAGCCADDVWESKLSRRALASYNAEASTATCDAEKSMMEKITKTLSEAMNELSEESLRALKEESVKFRTFVKWNERPRKSYMDHRLSGGEPRDPFTVKSPGAASTGSVKTARETSAYAMGESFSLFGTEKKFWAQAEHSDFVVRQKGYLKSGQKGASEEPVYELLGTDLVQGADRAVMDLLKSKHSLVKRLNDHVHGERRRGDWRPSSFRKFPEFLVFTQVIPTESGFPMSAHPETDRGVSIVSYYRLSEESRRLLRSSESLTPQLTMLQGLVANGKSLKKNFCVKLIAKCKNLKEVSKKHQLSSLLSKFNGKPHLLAASVKPFASESNVLEITCDMRTWGYLAKSRAVANYSILPDAVIQAGLTIEGRSDCELPEQLLGCFELRFADLVTKGDAVRRV